MDVERVAFGMYVLEASPIFDDHEAKWAALGDKERDMWMARARFVLSYAEVGYDDRHDHHR